MSLGSSKLVPAFVALGVLCGAALGSWGQRAWTLAHAHGPTRDAAKALEHLDHELGLDAGQKDAVKKILLDRQTELDARTKAQHESEDALRQKVRGEIAAALKPDQQIKFKALCDRADQKIKERRAAER
jgi:hypothetical protein